MVKRWQLDAFPGVSASQLQSYLDEFRYLLDRRGALHDLLRRTLHRCAPFSPPTTYRQPIAA